MTAPYWQDEQITLHLGDCIEVLAGMAAGSVDAIVTDPPYGLEFMGKEWDRPWAVTAQARVGFEGREDNLTLPTHRDGRNANCRACGGRARGAKRCACEHPDWDRAPTQDMRDFQAWCEAWATECLRVLKPGGHLLAFGSTRTYHRLACAIEDAGFEIRDSIDWIYGSGFPKSLDVSKAIDRAAGAEREVIGAGQQFGRGAMGNRSRVQQGYRVTEVAPEGGAAVVTAPATSDAARWDGWGTALKPAHEPIVVARKPLAGTVAANVLEHGTGALNIDACRIPVADEAYARNASGDRGHADNRTRDMDFAMTAGHASDGGRWPPNLVLGEEAAAEMDRQSGVLTSGANPERRRSDKFRDAYGEFAGQEECTAHRGADSGGASRFFPVFRYEAKAGSTERPRGNDGTAHPTVKPVGLMRWLVRLVTPPGGLVLDLFAGSGTTAEACIVEGFRCVLIEKDPSSCGLIRKRLSKDIQPVMFGGAA